MSTLQEQLAELKADLGEKIPEDKHAVMDRATEDLKKSGILDQIPTPGSPLPEFLLLDTDRNHVRSRDFLEKGPLVIVFYRGLW